MLKAVVWWYDDRHETGVAHDKVDLALETDDNGAWTSVVPSATDDNRQRVYLSEPDEAAHRIAVTGRDVTSDSAGCGTGGMKVWWTAYHEDSDRDDGPGGAGRQRERQLQLRENELGGAIQVCRCSIPPCAQAHQPRRWGRLLQE